jgi:hypothetical protein
MDYTFLPFLLSSFICPLPDVFVTSSTALLHSLVILYPKSAVASTRIEPLTDSKPYKVGSKLSITLPSHRQRMLKEPCLRLSVHTAMATPSIRKRMVSCDPYTYWFILPLKPWFDLKRLTYKQVEVQENFTESMAYVNEKSRGERSAVEKI